MSISKAFNSLRGALAREAKKERLGASAHGSPSEHDYWVADIRIDSMSHTALLALLAAHEAEEKTPDL